MRLNKFFTPIGLLSATALLVGCSSEEPVPAPDRGVGEEGGQFISLSLSGMSAQTRGDQPDWDTLINDLYCYITEKGSTKLVSLGTPVTYPTNWGSQTIADVDFEYDKANGKYEILVKLAIPLTAGKDYDLYLVANAPGAVKGALLSNADIKTIVWTHSAASWIPSDLAGSSFMPMNSDNPLVINIEDKEYTREEPYYAGGTKTDANRQSITLTRQFARLDYKTDKQNVYAISTTPQAANGSQGPSAPLFSVRFYQMDVVNIADKEFLFTTNSSATGLSATAKTNTFLSPSGITAGNRQSFDLPLDAPICYIPENIPAYSALDANSGVTFQTATYLEFYGLLTATDATPTDLKAAMTAHKDIYYYDDGTFQSLPRALADGEAEPSGNSWIKLEWKDVTIDGTATGGYLVKYRKAIRHNALDDTGAPASSTVAETADNHTSKLNADDGKVRAMEYAVRRNHVYQIGISAVRSLPRPVAETDPVETGKEALELQVKAPTAWTYHRQSAVVEVQ